jgi:hypothetical protein
MALAKATRTLRHGTTRQRADSILKDGPNLNFLEPGGMDPARGFSTYPVGAPISVGTAEAYAAGKAKQFPSEGGPAIVGVEVPEDIIGMGIDAGGEIRFEPGFGLDELLQAWPGLTKKVV